MFYFFFFTKFNIKPPEVCGFVAHLLTAGLEVKGRIYVTCVKDLVERAMLLWQQGIHQTLYARLPIKENNNDCVSHFRSVMKKKKKSVLQHALK